MCANKRKRGEKSVVKKKIQHEHYKETLFSETEKIHSMNFLRSEKHEIYVVKVSKTSLSPMDTKRWIANDGVNTRAFGFNSPMSEKEEFELLEFINELLGPQPSSN